MVKNWWNGGPLKIQISEPLPFYGRKDFPEALNPLPSGKENRWMDQIDVVGEQRGSISSEKTESGAILLTLWTAME